MPNIPFRRKTRDLSLSPTSSRSEDDPLPKPSKCPLISQLYSEAAEFEKVLVGSGCIHCRSPDGDGANGFDNLVGQDLSQSERAIAGRAVKLSAAGASWISEDASSESDSFYDTPEEDSLSSDAEESLPNSATIHRAPSRDSDDLVKLEPTDIVEILVDEFGPLAAPEEKEQLILETDGCLINDVAIVGVIHLTTHRVAFHASLLSTRPDLYSSQEVIKAGPSIFHRKGLHTKRRVWMELTSEMICAYASSSDEGKIRPICTVLLASIKKILPLDPKHPRHIRLSMDSQLAKDYVEFDTEESAHDWRRELSGALFLFRHRRREAYAEPASETHSGVRLSLPLDRISFYQPEALTEFPSIAALGVMLSDSDIGADEDIANPETQVFQIGPIKHIPVWSQMKQHIAAAKRRSKSFFPNQQSPIIVDFGPLSFAEVNSKAFVDSTETSKEKAVRDALGFSADSKLWTARARMYCTVTTSGYFAVSSHHVGFWSKNLTQRDLRYRISILSVTHVESFSLTWLKVQGMTLGIEGQADIKIVFKTSALRDEAVGRIRLMLEKIKFSPLPSLSEYDDSFTSYPTVSSPLPLDDLPAFPPRSPTDILAPLSRTLSAAAAAAADFSVSLQKSMPKVINIPRQLLVSKAPLHFACLTIGSRGDVQPYIALGLGLMREGHRVTIVTHEEYRDWIEGFGIGHRQAGGDPGALMKLSVENKMFSPEFFKESLSKFRPWLDQLLLDAWEGCKDAQVLLESPSAMAGVHIAEALGIPYFRTFTMPWTKTTEFPHAFLSPPVESPTFNSASYILFNNVIWTATSGQINRWRRQTLKIGNTDMGHLAQSKITFIYNFSPAVVSKPLDWPDSTIVSGYWFLDNPDLNWTPPEGLLEFMDQARRDQKPLVYIGFGSITVPNPNRVTSRIVEAVLRSDVRAIISKGWSSRMSKQSTKDQEIQMPPSCYSLDKVPHDWLFPKIDAAFHHGGAGTTGASLRAGIPTIIKPWFGDQFFWASRVQKLGAGLRVPSLRSNDIAAALKKATTSRTMKEKAALVGEKIRAEDGVHTAIHAIYTYLHRASQDRASLDKD